MIINSTTAYASNQATVSNSVLTLTDFGFTADEIKNAAKMYVIVNSSGIRCWWDNVGTEPTTSNGALFTVGLELYGENIANFKLIRDGSTDAEVAIILES